MKQRAQQPKAKPERGIVLLGLFTMIMVMGIMSGAAVQEWSIVEKREREAQLIFIQEQYAAGILEYQKKQGVLPATLDELVKRGGDGTTFMRKAYLDPITRAKSLEDWCLLKQGAAGRMVSSCAAEGQADNNLGLGSKTQFKPGEEVGTLKDRSTEGIAQPGGFGIVGVHSKSTEHAYNTLKRQEDTYDRWYYSITEFRQDSQARAIPGLPQGQGPQGRNPTQTGQPTGIGNPSSTPRRN